MGIQVEILIDAYPGMRDSCIVIKEMSDINAAVDFCKTAGQAGFFYTPVPDKEHIFFSVVYVPPHRITCITYPSPVRCDDLP